jgi:hypothetical protein
MPQPISLSLQLNSPCQENWNNMEPTEQGQFCNSCQKAVVDFTGLTDQQILQYFLNNPIPVCGRMLTTQKDRLYYNSTPKTNRYLSPVAASLLTLAAISSEAAPPAPLKANITQAQLPAVTATPLLTDSIIISGTVKNKQGVPIENVEIVFEQLKTLSDKDGNFKFTLPASFNKTAVIQFSYPGFDKEVRSYHPVMGSTSYEIILQEPYFPTQSIMGAIVPAFHLPSPFSSLYFQPSDKLDSKTEAFLRDLSMFIKNHFNEKFVIRPYYKSSKQKAAKISVAIQNFLVDKEGILEDRIRLAEPQLRKENSTEVIIEFAQDDE